MGQEGLASHQELLQSLPGSPGHLLDAFSKESLLAAEREKSETQGVTSGTQAGPSQKLLPGAQNRPGVRIHRDMLVAPPPSQRFLGRAHEL